MSIRDTPIQPDCFLSYINRGVSGERIFLSNQNYFFFLHTMKKNLLPVCDVFAYCLLPNHFHLLVKIKSEKEIANLVKVSNLDKLN
jgi:hypothetical protein